ncbi:MAG: biosis protein MshM [Panacagrimonas sp.]|nr:AAA family ATPase [Panacagrimonas sp.]MCC2656162.1 biosis protein MshM [Panacagrimonas sp.]
MYQEHFGLRAAPFGLTPDTDFFFAQASHQAALNTLLVALRAGEGFLKITGEIGLGKTTLCRRLLRALGEEGESRWVTAYLPHPAGSRAALITMVAEELGCLPRTVREREPELLLGTIQRRLLKVARTGARTVLVVDEAQALPDEALEVVRLLTNLETERDKLLQVVLFGQPELDQRLARPELRQLRQRIGFSHRLGALSHAQFGGYVAHRLTVAGGAPELFADDALDLLYRASRGVPRTINMLCHKSLLAAYGPGAPRVGRAHALAAIADTESARLPLWQWPAALLREHPGWLAAALGAGAGLALLLRYVA